MFGAEAKDGGDDGVEGCLQQQRAGDRMISWVRYILGQTQEAIQSPATMNGIQQPQSESLMGHGIEAESEAEQASVIRWTVGVACFFVAVSCALVIYRQHSHAQRLESELSLAREDVSRLMTRNRELTQELASLQSERDTLDDRVFSIGMQLSSASAELGRLRMNLVESERLAKQLSQARLELQTHMATASREREELQQDNERLRQEKTEMGRTVSRLRYRAAFLEKDYKELETQLAQAKEQAAQQAASALAAAAVAARQANAGATSTTTTILATDESAHSEWMAEAVANGRKPAQAASAADNKAEGPVPFTVNAVAANSAQADDAPVMLTPDLVELPPVVVRHGGIAVSRPVSAQLVDIDESHRFVVVNKGRLNGLHEGMVLDIVRDSTSVGQVAVVSVRPQSAACNILSAPDDLPLHVGDLAVERLVEAKRSAAASPDATVQAATSPSESVTAFLPSKPQQPGRHNRRPKSLARAEAVTD